MSSISINISDTSIDISYNIMGSITMGGGRRRRPPPIVMDSIMFYDIFIDIFDIFIDMLDIFIHIFDICTYFLYILRILCCNI